MFAGLAGHGSLPMAPLGRFGVFIVLSSFGSQTCTGCCGAGEPAIGTSFARPGAVGHHPPGPLTRVICRERLLGEFSWGPGAFAVGKGRSKVSA